MANESGSLVDGARDCDCLICLYVNGIDKHGKLNKPKKSFFKENLKYLKTEPILKDPNRFPNKKQELTNSVKDKTSKAFSMDFFIIALIFFVFICSLIGLVGKG